MQRLPIVISVLYTLVLLSTTPAIAQDSLVREAHAGIAAIGKQWNGEVNAATQALYTPLQRAVDAKGLVLHRDISYGDHALQIFDLWTNEGGYSEGAPILVYFHGGGLTGGDKVSAATDNLIYTNIGKFAARLGGIGINANYRLAPEAKFPDGAQDLAMIIQWVHDNIADYGGDPDNIVIMGNSAGSTHVASYLFHEESQLDEGPGVMAAILSSCGCASGSAAYYGDDAALREANSPLGLVDSYTGEQVPLFMWSAQYDPTFIETSVADLYAKLCRKYADCPQYTQWQGYNHVSHVMSIDSADAAIGEGIIRFLDSLKGM